MADIAVVGLDIGKRLFHVISMDQAGHVVLRRRCSLFLARLARCGHQAGAARPWSQAKRVRL